MSNEDQTTAEEQPKPPRGNTTRWKAGAILAAVFILGAAAGGAGMRTYMLQRWRSTMSVAPSEGRARFRLEAMSRRLDLSDEQRAKLEAILVDAEKERAAVTEGCRPQLEELQKRLEEQVDAILTDEQRAKHREMLERMREHRKDRRGPPRHDRRGPPPDGP